MSKKINVDIQLLSELTKKPAYGAMGEPLWTDPHIAGQMLAAHLDPETDGASRRFETIRSTTNWLVERLGMKPGSKLLEPTILKSPLPGLCERGLYSSSAYLMNCLWVSG